MKIADVGSGRVQRFVGPQSAVTHYSAAHSKRGTLTKQSGTLMILTFVGQRRVVLE
jgi:hypothetical protein